MSRKVPNTLGVAALESALIEPEADEKVFVKVHQMARSGNLAVA
jgi:hypothetical protein